MHIVNALVLSMAAATLVSCSTQSPTMAENSAKERQPHIWPQLSSEVKRDPKIEIKVRRLLASMTLEQKVAQMIQPEIRDISVEDMRRYGFGSYLNGGGAFPNGDKHAKVEDWVDLAEAMYQASIDDSLDASAIPTMWGTDAVHGHNNVLGATLFPHNIGLGAANDPELIQQIAKVTATEVMVTGIDWVFAPTVATVRDDRWGRTYEGYSEDPDIVKAYAAAIVKGLQGSAEQDFLGDRQVISTVKHFVGDGGTLEGDDQGDNQATEQALFDLHAQGYVGGLGAGAQSVMASFNSWQGDKIHGNRYLLTDVLKDRMGFDGFVVGDWNGHGQVKGCSNESCPQAINAGLDIFMAPTASWKPLLENTIAQVEQGIIPISRIDDAVARILRVKYRANLFDKPSPAKRALSGKTALVGSDAHRELAQQAVRKSLVLLKNNNSLLPISPKLNVLVAGDAADNIGKQAGGWTITWQGTNNQNSDFPGGSSIYDGLAAQINAAGGHVELSETGNYSRKPDVAIVVFGEEPYAEGVGDRAHLAYQAQTKKDLLLLKKLKAAGIPVISVFISGRPMWVNAELNASDAFVAAWLPGSEGKAIADVLLTDKTGKVQHDFVGKLSFSWPQDPMQTVNKGDEDYDPLFAYGFGLNYATPSYLANNLNEEFEFDVELDTSESHELPIFAGKPVSPWQMLLTSGKEQVLIQSNSQSLAGIAYRTIDDQLQEDAFRLQLDGSQTAGITFSYADPGAHDLSSQLSRDSQLILKVKREGDIKQPLYLSMCDELVSQQANCSIRYDLAWQLMQAPAGEWVELAVDLAYFIDQGVNLSSMVSPFILLSHHPIELSLSHIYFKTDRQDHEQNCDSLL